MRKFLSWFYSHYDTTPMDEALLLSQFQVDRINRSLEEYFFYRPTVDTKGVMRFWIPIKVFKLLAATVQETVTPI